MFKYIMARCWYAYRPDIGLNKSDPANYRQISRSILGTETCLTGDQICAIYAPGCDVTPDSPFSRNLLDYITTSTTTTVPLPVGAGRKKYLYKKEV